MNGAGKTGGDDGTRTRDALRDRRSNQTELPPANRPPMTSTSYPVLAGPARPFGWQGRGQGESVLPPLARVAIGKGLHYAKTGVIEQE